MDVHGDSGSYRSVVASRTIPKSSWRTAGFLLLAACLPAGCGGGRHSGAVRTTPAPPASGEPARPAVRLDPDPAVHRTPPAPFDDGKEIVEEPLVGSNGSHPSAKASWPRHRIRKGETLYRIARQYGVSVGSLARANGIADPTRVRAGTILKVPLERVRPAKPRTQRVHREHASDPRPADAPGPPATEPSPVPVEASFPPAESIPEPSEEPAVMGLAWPLGGRITAGFGPRGRHRHHEGIDIDGTRGQTVRAVAPGAVIRAETDGSYGRLVVIDHGDGVTTLYAHASRLLVDAGDRVDRNDPIAEVGRSGNASGTHLHFEMRRNGRAIDPLPYLKSGALDPLAE
jgi:murein DD-endopeptidase MepM/ murein hydrolase activator NlpD